MVSRPARLWGPLLLLLTMVVPAPVLATGSGRLPRDVLPTSEHLKLNLDARKPRYSGSAVIQLRAMTAVDSLQLHSEGLTLTRVTVTRGRAPVLCRHQPTTPT